jgi:apolipoprotein N-acyltransferase
MGTAFNISLQAGLAGSLSPLVGILGIYAIIRSLNRISSGRAALNGTLAMTAGALVGLFWMNQTSLVAYLLLCLYMSIFGLALGLTAARLQKTRGVWSCCFLLAAAWCAMEFTRSLLFSGFPWMLTGSLWAGWPAMLGPADIGGVHLLTFLTVLPPAAINACQQERNWRRLGLVLGLIPLTIIYSAIRNRSQADGEKLRVAVIQACIPYKVGPHADTVKQLRIQQKLTATIKPRSTDLVIWSETMLTGPLRKRAPEILGPFVRAGNFWSICGGVLENNDAEESYHNSALLLDPQGKIAGRYDKRHLVPFGEYIPMDGAFPGAETIFRISGNTFTPGQRQPLMLLKDIPIGLSICYEDIFPEISREDARRGAELLVNITNDGWFLRSSQPRQHLALASLRSVETRLPMIRATNTGISALISANGKITIPTNGDLWERGVVRIDLKTTGQAHSLYLIIGDLLAWTFVLVSLAALIIPLLRRKN